jgi:hypothetical protein
MNQNSKNPPSSTNARDHFAVLKARAENMGKPTYSPAEVRARLGLPAKR